MILNYGSSSIKIALYTENLYLIEKYNIKDINQENFEEHLKYITNVLKKDVDIFIHRVVHGMD
ncbi:MAG: hypothetical protein RMJ36_03365, partial [Candidatus Calescibacterium sp.]|nr:hypothetical protein [Candidatus Calescibacterium sp.]MDW8132675.1 hypothetical protein [Candidatus Calescibacterium sp.]